MYSSAALTEGNRHVAMI